MRIARTRLDALRAVVDSIARNGRRPAASLLDEAGIDHDRHTTLGEIQDFAKAELERVEGKLAADGFNW